jgi:hypothetical protein
VDVVTIALFAVLVTGPALLTMVEPAPPTDAETGEKRQAATWPRFPQSRAALQAYPAGIDAWLNDHFGLRQALIHAHSRLLYFGLHTSPSPKVVRGRDGWLFYHGTAKDGRPIVDYRGAAPLSPAHLEWLRLMIQDQSEWFQRRGIRYLFVLAPSKEFVYEEFMPSGLRRREGPNPREQLLAHLAGRGLPVLDLTPALLEAKRQALVFDRTDTHWNAFGSLVASNEIIATLRPAFPALRPDSLDQFQVREAVEPGGDLAAMLDLSDALAGPVSKLEPRTPRRGRPTPVSDKPLADVVGGVGDPALPRAVVYRDSYTETLIPFLTEHFAAAGYVWSRLGANMKNAPAFSPHVVLQIMADRSLRLDLHYGQEIQQEALRHRVERGRVLWRRDGDLGGPLSGFPDARLHLPVLRVRLTASRPVDLTLAWRGTARARHRAAAGTGDVFLPVFDPQAQPPLQLTIGQPRNAVIHGLELIEIPR